MGHFGSYNFHIHVPQSYLLNIWRWACLWACEAKCVYFLNSTKFKKKPKSCDKQRNNTATFSIFVPKSNLFQNQICRKIKLPVLNFGIPVEKLLWAICLVDSTTISHKRCANMKQYKNNFHKPPQNLKNRPQPFHKTHFLKSYTAPQNLQKFTATGIYTSGNW